MGELYAQGDREKSAGLLQNGILFYTLLGFAMAVVQYSVIPLMYRLGQPVDVVDAAIPYYRMLVFSMPFVMLFFAFKQFLEGVGNTKVEMVVTIVANLANIGFNWVFIYGRFSLPEMGAEGAGLGTLLSRIIAPILMVGYFYSRERYRGYLDGFSPRNYSWATVKKLLHMGLPISMQMFLEASAFVGTGIMMGWFNKETMSANQIAVTIGNCAFMIVMSIGAATTIRVSHCYGARNIGELSLAAKASYHLVLAWNAFAALVFITMRNVIPTFFTTNAEVIAIASQLMVFAALYQLSDGIQNVSVGILRGIQDVKIIMPIAFVSYWLLNLPVGYLFGFTLGMGPSGLFLGFVRSVGRRRDDDPPHTTQHTTLVPQQQLKIKNSEFLRIFTQIIPSMDTEKQHTKAFKPEIGRGCSFCNCGSECEAKLCDGCFKLHETAWLEEYPEKPSDRHRRSAFQEHPPRILPECQQPAAQARGDIVAVEASPGHDIGIVSLTGDLVARQMRRTGFNPFNGEFKKIYRKAKPYDIEKWQEAIELEHETMIASRQIAADMGLNMKIGDVEYQGDKIKAIFYYIADERVDFRELIKVFAERFHIRIEMKQIGARQEADASADWVPADASCAAHRGCRVFRASRPAPPAYRKFRSIPRNSPDNARSSSAA